MIIYEYWIDSASQISKIQVREGQKEGQKRKKAKKKKKKRTVGVQPLVGSSNSFFSQSNPLQWEFLRMQWRSGAKEDNLLRYRGRREPALVVNAANGPHE